MSAPEGLGSLNTTNWENLQELADSLEQAWNKGESVDLGGYLPPPGANCRSTILQELIKTDLECRWRRGQGVSLDHYLEKFAADLGPAHSLAPSLICEEYRVRQLFGDEPPLQQYQNRFPNQFAELEKLVRDNPQSTRPPVSPDTSPHFPSEKPQASFGKNTVLTQTGGYTLMERIGTGGFAEVFKAKAPGGVLKAIKIIIRPIDQAEAKREVEAMELIKHLRHHFLLPIHQFWALEDRLIILMDLADETLRQCLERYKKEGATAIPLPELMRYLGQAAEALDYLHKKSVLHRDIKPENILLTEGNVRVADFGLAKSQGTQRMMDGTFAGTPLYMPPETWEDKAHIHGDQYSLAATFFELRTGHRLYKDASLPALMHNHLHVIPCLDALGEEEKKVLLRALSKNPEDRYKSCGSFASAWVKALGPNFAAELARVDEAELDEKDREFGESNDRPVTGGKPLSRRHKASEVNQEITQARPSPPPTAIKNARETFEIDDAASASTHRTPALDALAKRRPDLKPLEAPANPQGIGPATRVPGQPIAGAETPEAASAGDDDWEESERVGRDVMRSQFGPDQSPSPAEARGTNWKNQKAKTQIDPASTRENPAVVGVKKIAKPPVAPPLQSKWRRRLALFALGVVGLAGIGAIAAILIFPQPEPVLKALEEPIPVPNGGTDVAPEIKPADLVDLLLKRSKNEEWKSALASLQIAEKHASDSPQSAHLRSQIEARRVETIKQYRDPILQKAEQALKKKEAGGRDLLEHLRQTDKEVVKEFNLFIERDMREKSLWALVNVQSTDAKENDDAIDYFREVNRKDNRLLYVLCRDFCHRFDNGGSNTFKEKAEVVLREALPNLKDLHPGGDAPRILEVFLAKIEVIRDNKRVLESARASIKSKDRARLNTALENLRELKSKIEGKDKQECYKLFAALAEEYVEGNVDIPRPDLSILQEGNSYVGTSIFPRAMAKYIQNVCHTWPENGDWKTRFENCQLAEENDPWVEACIQECLREDEALGKAHRAEMRTDIRGADPYSRYVRGIITHNAAPLLEKEALDPSALPWFAVDKRRAKAAVLLKDAAKSLRKMNEDGFYESKEAAEQAYAYLVLAGKWLNAEAGFKAPDWSKVCPDYKVELAFAALFNPDPNWDLGTNMANDLLGQPGTLRDLGDPERKLLALVTAKSYQSIREKIKSSAGPEKNAWRTPLDQVVALAEAAGARIDAKRHAMLLAAKGWLLDHPDNKGSSNDPKQAFETFDKAFKKDPQSEYLEAKMDSSFAKSKDKTKEHWAELKKDADRLPPNQPSRYKLAARIDLKQSRLNPGERITFLTRAYVTMAQAGELIKDENWPEILYLHSVVSLELGNYLYAKDKRDEVWKKYLKEATEFAETCSKTFPNHKPGEVQLALGYAREDLAFFCKIDEETNYTRAEEAFTAAIRATEEPWAKPWVARGRARYRWSEFKREKKEDSQPTKLKLGEITKLRTRALADLTESLKQNPSVLTKGEAHYWVGVIWVQNKDLQKAQEAFALALKDQKHTDISRLALQGLADLSLGEGRRLRKEKPKDAKKNADQAKIHIDELLTFDESFETRNALASWGVLVLEWEFDQNPRQFTAKRASDILKQALPKRDSKNATPYQVRLVNKYVDVQLRLKENNSRKKILLDDMEFAIDCLKGDSLVLGEYNNLKADTYYLAAWARYEGPNPDEHRIEAVNYLKNAIKFGENHSQLFLFRTNLASQLYELMKLGEKNREVYREESLKELDEALKMPLQNEVRSAIEKKREEIKGYKKRN